MSSHRICWCNVGWVEKEVGAKCVVSNIHLIFHLGHQIVGFGLQNQGTWIQKSLLLNTIWRRRTGRWAGSVCVGFSRSRSIFSVSGVMHLLMMVDYCWIGKNSHCKGGSSCSCLLQNFTLSFLLSEFCTAIFEPHLDSWLCKVYLVCQPFSLKFQNSNKFIELKQTWNASGYCDWCWKWFSRISNCDEVKLVRSLRFLRDASLLRRIEFNIKFNLAL